MSVKTFKKRCCLCKTWRTRNNSSNVASILKPEEPSHLEPNTCYCREKTVRPKLFQKPKQCTVIDPDVPSREDYLSYSYPTTSTFAPSKEHHLKECDRNEGLYRKNETEFSENGNLLVSRQSHLKKYGSYFDNFSKVPSKNCNCYDDTQKGNTVKTVNTEDWSNFSYSDGSKRREPDDKHQSEGPFDDEHYETQEDVENQILLAKERPATSDTDVEMEAASPVLFLNTECQEIKNASSTHLRQISDFRKDHYFETHSTEDLIKTIPEHICVHRFGLDSRLLPEPLHADGYGVSRCIICDKPMETTPVNKVDQRYDTTKENVFPKFYKYGLAPKKIYLGNDAKVKIEMELNCDRKRHKLMKLEKKPSYADTYALRYQKGVI